MGRRSRPVGARCRPIGAAALARRVMGPFARPITRLEPTTAWASPLAPRSRLSRRSVRLQTMNELSVIPTNILDAVKRYNEAFRHPSLRQLTVSDLYALFPDEPAGAAAKLKWPEPWPNGDSPGVYLVFGPALELLYVGKAWNLNSRVSSYFRYASDGSRRCELRHAWRHRPALIATIAVDADKFFEAAGLEEYLIETLRPLDNERGARNESAP
jgi:hypothetical protein